MSILVLCCWMGLICEVWAIIALGDDLEGSVEGRKGGRKDGREGDIGDEGSARKCMYEYKY